MARKCNNCAWEGEKANGIYFMCPVCGDNTTEQVKDIPVDMSVKPSNVNIFMAKTSEEDEEFVLKEEQKQKKRGKR